MSNSNGIYQLSPLSESAYYGVLGHLVKTIEPHTEADPAGLLFQFLLGFGNMIGRNSYFRVEATHHYTNLNLVLVGATSGGRKGTSWNQVSSILKQVDPQWRSNCVKSGASSGEGIIYHVRDAPEVDPQDEKADPRRSSPSDNGVSDKRMLLCESEFASLLRVLSREGNTLSAVLRNAWDGEILSTLTRNSPLKATGAHISIIGHIPKQELLRYLADTEAANGFGNRFNWISVKRARCLPDGGNLQNSEIQMFIDEIKCSYEYARTPRQLVRSQDAQELWHSVYPKLTAERSGLLGAMTARAAPQTLRFATIYAILDRSEMITSDHLKAALALWDYCESSCRYIFQETLGNPDAEKIISYLRLNTGGASATDLHNLFGRNRSITQLREAIALLKESHLVSEKEVYIDSIKSRRWFPIDSNLSDNNFQTGMNS